MKFYECDPYVPHLYEGERMDGDFFASPLHFFNGMLHDELRNASGEIVALAGTRAVELGFVEPLHNFEKRYVAIHGMLIELGLQLQDIDNTLKGVTPLSEDEEARFSPIRRAWGEKLPDYVIGHTARMVGEIAVSDFGFTMAQSANAAREDKRLAIQVAGHEPVTVYMATRDFLQIPADE
jgi:hypothetical protein